MAAAAVVVARVQQLDHGHMRREVVAGAVQDKKVQQERQHVVPGREQAERLEVIQRDEGVDEGVVAVGHPHVRAERLERLRAQLVDRVRLATLDLAHLLDGDALSECRVQALDERDVERLVAVVLHRQQDLARVRHEQLDAVDRLACLHAHAPELGRIEVGVLQPHCAHHLAGREVQLVVAAFGIGQDAPVVHRQALVELEFLQQLVQAPRGCVPVARGGGCVGRVAGRRRVEGHGQHVALMAAQVVEREPVQGQVFLGHVELGRERLERLRVARGQRQSAAQQRKIVRYEPLRHEPPLPIPFSRACSQKWCANIKILSRD